MEFLKEVFNAISPYLVEAIASIIMVLIGLLVMKAKQYITEKVSAEKLNKLKNIAKMAVLTVEQLDDAGLFDDVEEKSKIKYQEAFDRVENYLLNEGIVFDILEIQTAIESAVKSEFGTWITEIKAE